MSGNRIERIFGELRGNGRKGLMPFVCGGWPTVESTGAILPTLEAAGASIVEVGIPFSDPIADGPTIAAAMHRALEAGATPEGVIEVVCGARGSVGIGLVAMVSVSIVGRFGAGRFARMIAEAGFDGVIYPDLPVEEAEAFTGPAREAGLTATLLVAPNTPGERAERIAAASSGFVYLMTRVGITGEGTGPGSVRAMVDRLRGMTDLPVACGFGIARAEQVRQVVWEGGADAAIVGSALVRRMTEAADAGEDAVEAGAGLVRELAGGLGD